MSSNAYCPAYPHHLTSTDAKLQDVTAKVMGLGPAWREATTKDYVTASWFVDGVVVLRLADGTGKAYRVTEVDVPPKPKVTHPA
jgi:hypothetical protein